jgi:pantoate--beta-alanine ligase
MGMKIFKKISSMQKFSLSQKEKGKKIGFVPTMGYFHQGHLSLMKKARKENDIVVVSIFVNPTQFGPQEDFNRYPRDLKRDLKLAKDTGVDVIFYPQIKDMYPKGYNTYVEVKKLTDVLCGKSRLEHFKGVTTVCTKLFNIVLPDIAYFGQKDAQQAIVIKRMVHDLNMPLKIKVLPIIREEDGLAMSSRNLYLTKEERKQATILYSSLLKAKKLFKEGECNAVKIKRIVKNMIKKMSLAKIDYVEIVSLDNLTTVKEIKKPSLLAVACWFGKARLIDNIILK